jgi:hypothetical protein
LKPKLALGGLGAEENAGEGQDSEKAGRAEEASGRHHVGRGGSFRENRGEDTTNPSTVRVVPS